MWVLLSYPAQARQSVLDTVSPPCLTLGTSLQRFPDAFPAFPPPSEVLPRLSTDAGLELVPVHYCCAFMDQKESTEFLFLALLLIVWLISFSLTRSCFASQLHRALGFAGADPPEPLAKAGISLGVDFLMPVEFLLSFPQCVVSQGAAGWQLQFL